VHLALYLGDLARTPYNFQIKEILEIQPELGVRVEVSRQAIHISAIYDYIAYFAISWCS